jgi:hypothetical protein
LTFLADPEHLIVDGIPEELLRATTVQNVDGGAGYPSVEHLVKNGISRHAVEKLTDYQRGGVDFVLSRNGRGICETTLFDCCVSQIIPD